MARSRTGCGVLLLTVIIILLVVIIILLQNPSLLNRKGGSSVRDYIDAVKKKAEKTDLNHKIRKSADRIVKEVLRETAERSVDLYFARYVESMDRLKLVKVTRKIKPSDTPLTDALESLLAGPSAAEEKQGIISLFPARLKLLDARVRGGVAYLDFNSELESGVGESMLKARLNQIVYTATQFPSVTGVRILIDHREKSSFSAEKIPLRGTLKRTGEEPVF